MLGAKKCQQFRILATSRKTCIMNCARRNMSQNIWSTVLNLLLNLCKIIKTKVYNPLLTNHRSNPTLRFGGKKSSAAYFQLSCARIPNEIFNRNLSFINFIYTTCAETSLPLPPQRNVFSFTTHCSFSFYCKLMRCIQFRSHIL